MHRTSKLYTEVSPSSFAWEREAIDFVREGMPDHEPHRLWSNFEFTADDGSMNEVDLLAVSPAGVFLIEIKSRPGIVTGDQHTLEWHDGGRVFTADNPLLLTNRKAKKLKSLLAGTKAFAKKGKLPFIQAKLFLSHESNELQGLDDHLRQNIHLRDVRPGEKPDRFPNGRRGIVHAVTATEQRWVDKPMAKAITRALEEIGLRQASGARRVGDWRLDEVLVDTLHYQDWSAKHASLEGERARIRIYQVERSATDEQRQQRRNAARREYQILKGIEHEGFLRAMGFSDHESGPALVFEHFPRAQRLDHYLKERGANLDVDARLHLVRTLAETVRYAHEKNLVHRALAPQCVLVLDPDANTPQLKVTNWQTGTRGAGTTQRTTLFGLSGTRHVGDLTEDQSLVYVAPEVHQLPHEAGEQADVFSLGAIAYHVFAQTPPATDVMALEKALRQNKALDLAGTADAIPDELDLLVDASTQVDASQRLASAEAFLDALDAVEDALTTPEVDENVAHDPTQANKGERLEHGLTVEKRLGKGSSAVALLVRRHEDDKSYVLKVSLEADHNDRLHDEAEALRKLRSPRIVELHDELAFGPRTGLLLQWASEGTLAERLRTNGAEQPELLERFGNDLLEAVTHLEERGVSHRDIKPENLGLIPVGRGDPLHLVLFDFSLTRTSAENIAAGTTGYLDPFLEDRGRYDVHAERFAVAVTLYQMATGLMPQWGDGKSAPWAVDDEVRLSPESFVPALREPMIAFFGRALRRDYRERFDTIEEMRQAWTQVFAEKPRADKGAQGDVAVDEAELTTPASLLSPSTRALHALERAGVETVEDWLRIPLSRLTILRGVGSKTRRELLHTREALQRRFPDVTTDPQWRPVTERAQPPEPVPTGQTIDQVVAALWPKRIDKRNRAGVEVMRVLLGLDPVEGASPWPSQNEVADAVRVKPPRIGQVLKQFRKRWGQEPALTAVRDDVEQLLDEHGGVMMSTELAEALASLRGDSQQSDDVVRSSRAVVRAALEAESERARPRWVQRRPRSGHALFVARHEVDDDGTTQRDGNAANEYAVRLGRAADTLAAADPLLGPERALERLQAVERPSSLPALAATRLRALATAASEQAALSWRQEIYPRGMSAERALTLALGAVSATRQLSEDELRQRVAQRYPQAAPLPARPELDRLLRDLGSGLTWNPEAQCYEQPTELPTSYRTTVTRTTLPGTGPSDHEYERREFDRKLRASLDDGRFLALTVRTRWAERARAHLAEHYDVDVWSVDDLMLEEMRRVADARGPNVWDTVLKADAQRPDDEGAEPQPWRKLRTLIVDKAWPAVLQRIEERTRPVLLVHPGLLARYQCVNPVVDALLQPPSDGRPRRAVWMLVAGEVGDEHPRIDDQLLPLYQKSQWVDVPHAVLGSERTRTPADDV